MTARSCPHGMPTPASCWPCMEDGNLDPPPPTPSLYARGPRLIAQHPGHCAGCNLAIHEGQAIVRMSDDSWQHTECGDPR